MADFDRSWRVRGGMPYRLVLTIGYAHGKPPAPTLRCSLFDRRVFRQFVDGHFSQYPHFLAGLVAKAIEKIHKRWWKISADPDHN